MCRAIFPFTVIRQTDLTVDPKRFVSQMEIVDRFFDTSSCEIAEGSVGGTGYRRLLRFDTVLINGGDGPGGRQSDRSEQSVSFSIHLFAVPHALSHQRFFRLQIVEHGSDDCGGGT